MSFLLRIRVITTVVVFVVAGGLCSFSCAAADILGDKKIASYNQCQNVNGTTHVEHMNEYSVLECLAITNSQLEKKSDVSDVREVVFIDAAVENYEILLSGLDQGKLQRGELDVKILLKYHSGITQINEHLEQYQNQIEAVHIVSHGNVAKLYLGSDVLDYKTLEQNDKNIRVWSSSLKNDADILLYGCNVANGENGHKFISALSGLLKVDIAASENVTGSKELGGNWDLEYTTGTVATSLAFNDIAQNNFNTILIDAPVITSVIDYGSNNLVIKGTFVGTSGKKYKLEVFGDTTAGGYDAEQYLGSLC